MVSSSTTGDTFVVVFYDNAVAPVSVLHPLPESQSRYPANTLNATHTEIDRLVIEKLNKPGITRSPVADDATFLRRITLDITGTLPTADEVRQFLADGDPDKRSNKINRLLRTPAYAATRTTFLCDMTGNNSIELNRVSNSRSRSSQKWYDWIYKRVDENVPYDRIVEGIVLSSSREQDESYVEYCEAMCESYRGKTERRFGEGTAPFADRTTMPYYWMRQSYRDGTSRAISFAHSFMGIRIQCAQCHKHPFDQWTQNDFIQFSRFFTGATMTRVQNQRGEKGKEVNDLLTAAGIPLKNLRGGDFRKQLVTAMNGGQTVPFPELKIHPPLVDRKERKKQKNKKQKYYTDAILLGSDDVDLTTIEDLSLANPPSNGPLLDYLADGFVRSGHDLKWLHREIANSTTYQLSWEPNESNRADRRNFSHAIPRRLSAEIALDAVRQALANGDLNSRFKEELAGRSIAIAGVEPDAELGKNARRGFALQVFGRSTRTTSCDCDRSDETSLSQTIYLQNDRDIHQLIEREDRWVQELRAIHFESNINIKERREIVQLESKIAKLDRRQKELAGTDKKAKSEKLRDQIFKLDKKLRELKQRRARQTDPDAVKLNPQGVVVEAYLRTLSRYPTEAELERCLAFLSDDPGLRLPG